ITSNVVAHADSKPQGGRMKRWFISGILMVLTTIPAGAQQVANTNANAPQTQAEKISYAIGVQMAEGLKSQQIAVDPAKVAQGLRDALSGSQLLMSQNEIIAAIGSVQQELKQKADQARATALEKNKKEGEAFLAENAKKDGVVSLPDGLE